MDESVPPPPRAPAGPLSKREQHAPEQWFRSATLAARVPGAALKASLRARERGKRPTWNPTLEAAITALRSAARNAPRDVALLRAATSVAIPGPLLPAGCLRATERLAREDGTKLSVEWVWPRGRTPRAPTQTCSASYEVQPAFLGSAEFRALLGSAPVLVFVHGGAHCLCGRGTHRDLAFRLALSADCVVALPGFRRPPDVAVSEALDDVRAAYARVLDAGAAASRVCVGGDSAGGGLALAALVKMRDAGRTDAAPAVEDESDDDWTVVRPPVDAKAVLVGDPDAWRLPLPAGCVCISPWVDLAEDGQAGSRTANGAWDFLPDDLVELLADETVKASAGCPHSPLRLPLDGLPPVLVQAGQVEVLHDQQAAVARAAAAAGTPATLTVFRDMVHVFPIFAFAHETPRCALRQAGSFIRARSGAFPRPRVLVDVAFVRGAKPRRVALSRAVYVGARLVRQEGGRDPYGGAGSGGCCAAPPAGPPAWTDAGAERGEGVLAFGDRGAVASLEIRVDDDALFDYSSDPPRLRLRVVVAQGFAKQPLAEGVVDVSAEFGPLSSPQTIPLEPADADAAPISLEALVCFVDDAHHALPAGVAVEPAAPGGEAHAAPLRGAHRTPFSAAGVGQDV